MKIIFKNRCAFLSDDVNASAAATVPVAAALWNRNNANYIIRAMLVDYLWETEVLK